MAAGVSGVRVIHSRGLPEGVEPPSTAVSVHSCACPHSETHGHLGGCQYDSNPHYAQPKPVYAKGGPVTGGQTVWLNEYSEVRVEPARRTVISAQTPSAPRHGEVWVDPDTGEAKVFHAFGVTGQEAGERMKAALGGCPHQHPEPVELSTGEIVAAVCADCLQPLSPSWVGSDWRP